MVALEDLKDLTLYKKPFFLPIDFKDKKHKSSIMLLTPNYKSSMIAMTSPYMINKKYFESYYVEKSILKYIQNESVIDVIDRGEYLIEENLSSKDRNELDDSDFGIPELRKYPMPDKDHVLAAIRFFNHVEEKYEKELANNIIKKIKEFDMVKDVHVGKGNRFLPYWEKSGLSSESNAISESFIDEEEMSFISEEEYFTEVVNNNVVSKINKKIGMYKNVNFSGYEADIELVRRYLKYDSISVCFRRLKVKEPEQITITVTHDHMADHEFTDDSLVVLTPGALERSGARFSYDNYLRYTLQLYAVYTLKAPGNMYYHHPGRVMDSLAEPAAILLSGIADKELKSKIDLSDKSKDPFIMERIFKYIIDTQGIDRFRTIIASNDLASIMKASKECIGTSDKTDKFVISRLSKLECMTLIDEELEICNEEENSEAQQPSSEPITLDNPIPESIKKLQGMATSLKRKLRAGTRYKLNKIGRDVERGNVGTEARSANSLELLKSGDLSGIGQITSAKTELYKFNLATGHDYIMEGNYVYLFEDSVNYDAQLRKALFKDRFRSNKEVLALYSKVKADLPFIKYTFVDLSRYQSRNVFIDLSYYNESFFRNVVSLNEKDRSNTKRLFNIYIELLGRLIDTGKMSEKGYKKQTIFIPVLDWHHNDSTRMWMYKEDINPISALYYMMNNNLGLLSSIFKNNDVVFLGGKNYFKVNFGNTSFSDKQNVNKFLLLIKRIIKLGYSSPADPDPDDDSIQDSPKGIALNIIDKIEKSQNVEINNISKIETLGKEANLFDHNNNKLQPQTSEIATKKKVVSQSSDSGKVDIKAVKTITVKDTSKSASGKRVNATVEVKEKTVTSDEVKKDISRPSEDVAVNKVSSKKKKDAIVKAVADASKNATSEDEAIDNLENDDFKTMIDDLNNDSEENVRVDKTKASKVIATEEEFHKKEIAGKSVRDLLNTDVGKQELESTDLKISSINDDWKNLTFMNFDKNYDPDADIVKMLDSMQYWTFPVAVKNIEVKDNSTSEDYVDLWKIECVDYKGTKFTLKVDIPKFINGSNFLKLRGNEKVLMIQSALLPIIKTNLEECQIIGSGGYNKIFVRKFGARAGQSMQGSSRLMRALSRYIKDKHTDITIVAGDNSKVCEKYELPMDYIDLSSVYNTIEVGTIKIYFNQDELRTDYVIDDTLGIPVGIKYEYVNGEKTAKETVIYYTNPDGKVTISKYISDLICAESEEFAKIYNSISSAGARYSYSKASILNQKIPVVVICAYLEGLIKTLQKANITYRFEQELSAETKKSDEWDYIRFADGYLVYFANYTASLLLNGLKENDTESYSLKEINSRKMYFEFLENYGGNLKADGIENFYDCMLDPITVEILEKFKLPTDFVGVLIHASNLLADNKYVNHIDQSCRRWRRKELIAGYFYKALSSSYAEYANSTRHNRKNSKMTMKQSAIIDMITSTDPATSDLSVNNSINDVECANSVTNKGLVGMNSARSYTINTRGYDDSMLNLLGMDTGFSGNVGINRQATVNANIEGGRGFVKTLDGDTSKLSAANSFTITEAVTPFGSTHDDPPRTLMTFVQTSKHMVRCENSDPLLVTTGADEALPHLASDIFAYKAKQDGIVVEVVNNGFGKENYVVVEYKDGSHDFIDLCEEVKKNSDGGYYVPLKLDTDLEVGSKFKAGNILAYDKLSFSDSLGESSNLAANIGTLAKVAIINTDEGYEDSAAITESFSERLGTAVVMTIETRIDRGSNIFVYKRVGDSVMEGDTLFATQEDFEDDVVTSLLKNLTIDTDQLSELGRNPVKTKYTGIVEDIKIYRTCELDDMSDSLRSFVSEYERKVNKVRSVYKKYGIDDAILPAAKKVPEIGQTKGLENGVLVIYYIKYIDNMSVGDKIVFYSANKGIIKYIIPRDSEPYTSFRPNESIDSFMSLSSISGRMTCSIPIFGAVSKLMVELDRSVKDLAGIPYDDSKV